ncbi:MAG: multiheme c-type cytochrome [Nitrospirota bacterium]
MYKRVIAILLMAFIGLAGIARADLVEWKKMSFETIGDVPVFDSMDDMRKVFADPLVCSGCHYHHYEEWSRSYHAKSVNNAGFQALYLKYLEYLQREETKQELGREAGPAELRQCLFCHAPMVQFAPDRLVQQVSEAIAKGRWEEIRGIQISCVVCHSINPEGKWTGSFGRAGVKYGPIKDPAPEKVSGHGSKFSPLHEKSQFCASCHSRRTFNVYCSLVFEEWQGVKGAKQCQECHMEIMGKTAIAPGGKKRPDHSHLFPGGRSKETMSKALSLSLNTEKTSPNEIQIQVTMKNRIPHNVPDG